MMNFAVQEDHCALSPANLQPRIEPSFLVSQQDAPLSSDLSPEAECESKHGAAGFSGRRLIRLDGGRVESGRKICNRCY